MRLFFVFLAVVTSSLLHAQDLTGLSASNYGGLYRATYNPSVLGGSRYKWQLNVGTINSTISNRYFLYFGRNSLLYPTLASKTTRQLYGRSRTMGSLTNEDAIQVSSVFHLPSFMISVNKIHGFAVQVRSRGVVQGAGIPADIKMLYSKRLDTPKETGGSGSWGPFHLKQHSFTEIAFSYGVQLLDTPGHKFRAGATVKYLTGGRTSFIEGSVGDYSFETVGAAGENQVTLHDFSYSAGYTNPVMKPGLSDLFNKHKYGQGIGFDAGISYEIGSYWYRNDEGDSRPGYVLRLAASVNDIGQISYQTASSTRFSGGAAQWNMMQGEMETIANDGPEGLRNLLGGEPDGALRGKGTLPSMYHLEADLQLFKAFFIYASRSQSLRSAPPADPLLSVTMPNVFTIAPRWENEDSDYSFPISFIEGRKKVTIGLTGRVGPFHLGFSNFLGLFKGDSRGGYGYAGLSLFHLKTRDYRKKIKWKPSWD